MFGNRSNNNRNGNQTIRSLRREENQIRRSQLITPFGVGALTDINNRSVLIADSDFWDFQTVTANTFHDIRLQRAMHTEGFVEPPAGKAQSKVAVRTFPSWYFSPRTRELRPIWEWTRLLTERNSAGPQHQQFARKPFHFYTPKDTSKRIKIDLIPVRIVCACAEGHLQDFPWFQWAHSKGESNRSVEHHVLELKNISGSGTIGDMLVRCTCGKSRSLAGIFSETAGETLQKIGIKCHGNFGWEKNDSNHECHAQLKPIMRNSNSLYFPNIEKSVNIPLMENATIEDIQATRGYKHLEQALGNILNVEQRQQELNSPLLDADFNSISSELYEEDEPDRHIDDIRAKVIEYQSYMNESIDKISETDYRRDEYDVLMGDKPYQENSHRFNIKSIGREGFPNDNALSQYFERISLVNRLEVVSVLKSYSRIRPTESQWLLDQEVTERDEEGKTSKDLIREVSLKRSDRKYVGLRNQGEGIFVALNREKLNQWRQSIVATDIEMRILRKNDPSKIAEFQEEFIDPEYYLIHTLCHLIIRELSFVSGYSSSSLQERIYYSDASEKQPMCGFLVYTSSADSEGTLGGLVRQGFPNNFMSLVSDAIEKARWCSYDPSCIDSNGQGRDSLNLAACHACSLVSETSCEQMNLFLDRGVLIGTLKSPSKGYFSKILDE